MSSYPIYPNTGPKAVHNVEGTPGTNHAHFSTANPYPLHGDEGMQHLPTESTSSKQYSGAPQAGKHVNPYPVHGLQYCLDKAMAAPKNVMHFQSGDIRHAADQSGGSKVSENPSKVSAVSAALDAAAAGRVKGAKMGNQTSAFKQAQKGAKAGRPARDMALRHAGTQADVNSASTGY